MTMRVITRSEIEAREKLLSKLKEHNVTTTVPDEGGGTTEPIETEKKDSMLSALGKYIPVTVIVGYTFLDTIFRSINPPPAPFWMGIFLLMLVGAGLLTYRITDSPHPDIPATVKNEQDIKDLLEKWESVKNVQRLKQAVIAMIAFAGYVPSIGGPFPYIGSIPYIIVIVPGFVWQPYYGAVALVLATLVIAIIVAKDLLAD